MLVEGYFLLCLMHMSAMWSEFGSSVAGVGKD